MEESESIVISRLSIENALGIKMVSITPDGKPILLTGRNEAGKTSILKAIEAFRGKRFRDEDFIRHGAEKAVIQLDTPRWEAKLTVTAKTERLEVRPPGGKPHASPQEILNAWFGDVTFDPLAFKLMKLPEQVRIIRELTGLDTSAEDAAITEKYTARTEVNRRLKAAQAVLGQMPTYDEDLPEEPIPIKTITDELAECRELERQHFEAINSRETHLKWIKVSEDNITTWEEEIRLLQAKITDSKIAIGTYNQWLEENPVPEDKFTKRKAQAEQRLMDLDETNEKIRKTQERAKQEENVSMLQLESNNLSIDLTYWQEEKIKKLEAVKYPIEGLKLENDQLYFNGIPFQQLSTGRGMQISCAIAASLNPALRTILIRDGSLLDREGRAEVLRFAEERGFQVWMEMMDEPETIDGQTYYPAGFYMESGSIVAIDGQLVEEGKPHEA